MLKIEGREKIIRVENGIGEKEISGLFAGKGEDLILEYPGGKLLTKLGFSLHLKPERYTVKLSPDMFLETYHRYLGKTDVIGVTDDRGDIIGAIVGSKSMYRHDYVPDGGVDLWLLNQYDCLFLHDVNEASINLIRDALPRWTGKRLILVGAFWEELAEGLPDLPCVDVYLEPEEDIDEGRFDAYCLGFHVLHVTEGIPYKESMKRYELGILYYDEVMPLTYLFSKVTSYGEDNPDTHFCVIDMPYDNLGLMAIRDSAACVARYVKACGYTPVLNMANYYGGPYSNGQGDDMWTKFFCQPEETGMEDIKNCRWVHHVPRFYNGSILTNIMNSRNPKVQLSFPHGMYNEKVMETLRQKGPKFLPHPDETLGILARGTDYAKVRVANHPAHANPEQICEKVDETLREHPEYRYLYLSTEDEDYCAYFAKRYAGKITFTDQKRYRVGKGEMLMQMHEREKEKRDGFELGMEYILSIDCLARCRGLIASGSCTGLGEALRINAGRYQTTYVFQLPANPEKNL